MRSLTKEDLQETQRMLETASLFAESTDSNIVDQFLEDTEIDEEGFREFYTDYCEKLVYLSIISSKSLAELLDCISQISYVQGFVLGYQIARLER